MPLFAIVEDGGKQYRLQEGMEVDLERKDLPVGSRFEFDKVLMTSDGERVHIGTPYLQGARVTAVVTEHLRGPKVVVFTYKRRKNYHRKLGHRQHYTRVRVLEVSPPSE